MCESNRVAKKKKKRFIEKKKKTTTGGGCKMKLNEKDWFDID
jgi:hypothetical protein